MKVGWHSGVLRLRDRLEGGAPGGVLDAVFVHSACEFGIDGVMLCEEKRRKRSKRRPFVKEVATCQDLLSRRQQSER